MSDLGSADYEPRWLHDREAIVRAHGRRLALLAGQTLAHVWLVWDEAGDEWFDDCPVLLDLGDQRVEINHQKFNDLSITFNSVDVARPVAWLGADDLGLCWRAEPLPHLAVLRGQRLRDVTLLEWAGGDLAAGSMALCFTFGTGQLTVLNALDANGLDFGPPDVHWHQHPLR